MKNFRTTNSKNSTNTIHMSKYIANLFDSSVVNTQRRVVLLEGLESWETNRYLGNEMSC